MWPVSCSLDTPGVIATNDKDRVVFKIHYFANTYSLCSCHCTFVVFYRPYLCFKLKGIKSIMVDWKK